MLSRTNVITPRTLRSRSAAVLAALMLLGGFFVPLAPAQAIISTINLTSPLGGELWGGTHNVTWTTDPLADPETVDIVLKSTIPPFTTILADDTPNTGSYSFDTTAFPDGTTYNIEIAPSSNPIAAVSGGAFEIDNTAPILNAITSSVVTDAAPTGVLQIGDQITFTVSATTTEPNATVVGSYNGTTLAWSTADAGVTYTATYTVASGSADQLSALQISGVTMEDESDPGNVSLPGGGSDVAVTIDGTRPTLSSVSIASNHTNTAFAKNGSLVTLSFTSSEAINTPTVTIAGNPADSVTGGPTNWTATYTFTGTETEGAVPFSVTFSDVNGNTAAGAMTNTTDGSSVTYDETIPTISSITTKDTNGNGSVDTATIVFDAPVDDSTFLAGDFTIGGSAATGISTGTADDNTFNITISPEIAGTNVKQVTYTPGTGADMAGNLLAAVANGDIVEIDGAGPVMIAAETTSTTTIDVTFSEDLDGATDAISDFTVAGVTVTGTAESSGVITLTTTAFGTGDTPLISLVGNGVKDLPGNDSPSGRTITPTDGVAPVILSVTSTTLDGFYNNPNVINITVNFSEAITSSVDFNVTLDTGGSCSFAVTSAASGSCDYTIADGENSADLTTTAITGTAADLAAVPNAMTNFTPGSNLAANAAIVVDTTEPAITSLVLSLDGLHGVGDQITLTIDADQVGYSLSAGTVNGVAVTGFVDNLDTTYTATYTIVEGNDDRASGTVPASVELVDAAGNVNVAFTTVTANSVAIDANTPAAPVVALLDPINAGNVTAVTITGTGEIGATLDWSITDDASSSVVDSGSDVVDGSGNISVTGIDVSGLADDLDLTLSVTQTDAAGNTSAAGTDTALKDTVIPTLPAAGIVGTTIQGASATTGTNDTIVLTFSEPVVALDGTLDANDFSAIEGPDGTATILTGANFLHAGDTLTITLAESVATARTYLRNGDDVLITPASGAILDLADNAVVNVEVTSAASVSGDAVAPTVALTYSPNYTLVGGEVVTITAEFSELIDQQIGSVPQISIDVAGNGDLVATNMDPAGAVTWEYDWTVPSGVDDEGIATVTISATDLAGNSNATATNNTRYIDSNPPEIITFGHNNTATETTVVLSATTDTAATCRLADTVTDYASMAITMSGAGGTSHSYTVTGLTGNVTYLYFIRCQDAAGLTSHTTSTIFTTLPPDTTAPTVVGQTPADNATGVSVAISPTVTFSEAMDPSTVNTNTVKLKTVVGDVDVTGVVVTLSDSRLTATLNPSSALDYSTNYYIWVSGAKDAAGNDVTAYTTAVSQEFTTEASSADVAAPTVVSMSPADNATGVGISSAVAVTFNEPLMPSTVSSVNVELRKYSDNSVVASAVSLIEGDTTILITPNANLDFATQYYVAISTGVQDAVGNALAAALDNTTKASYEFTTVADSSDAVAPPVPAITTGATTTTASTYTILGTAAADTPSDSERVIRVYNGAVLAGQVTLPVGQTSWSVVVGLTLDTGNSITATSTDASANISAASSAVVITNNASADVDAPVISNIQATSISTSGVTITWTTDENATSNVEYGVTSSYGSSAPVVVDSSADNTNHSITISGLASGTEYHFRVTSADANTNSATSVDGTFTTTAVADTTPPAVPVFTTGAATTDADTYTLAGTVADDGGTRTVSIYNGATLVGSAVVPAGQTSWSFLAPLNQNASNVFSAYASDVAGNTSAASATVTITEATVMGDTTDPATPVISTGDTTTDANTYLLEGTAGPDVTTDSARVITIYRNGVVVGSLTLQIGETVWSFLAPLAQNAVNAFTATSTDAAGNQTVASNTVTITETEGAAALEVTNISSDPSRAFAIANDSYTNGWQWFFDVTIPTSEASVSMKFSDFVSGTNTIAAASNIRYYSAQSSNAATSGAAITVGAANTYAGAMTMTGDLDANTAGRQVRIVVEAKIPTGSSGGVYSADYGIQSL